MQSKTLSHCKRFGLVLALLLLSPASLSAQHHSPARASATLIEGLGTYGRKISTESQLAQQFFERQPWDTDQNVRNPFMVSNVAGANPTLSLRSNLGLKLANAFGVITFN